MLRLVCGPKSLFEYSTGISSYQRSMSYRTNSIVNVSSKEKVARERQLKDEECQDIGNGSALGASSVKGYEESWLYLKQAGKLASKRAIKDFYVVTLN